MHHLDDDLFKRWELGEPEAVRIHEAVGRLADVIAELTSLGVCDGCVVSTVEDMLDIVDEAREWRVPEVGDAA